MNSRRHVFTGWVMAVMLLALPESRADETVRKPFQHRYLAHAFGGIDGHTYLNCVEGFELNYAKGFRIFEADFWTTTDGHVVVANDGVLPSYGLPLEFTLQQFEESRILGQYTPVTLATLAALLRRYPDAMVMTDVKSDNMSGLDGICSELAAQGLDCHQRLIPQIYSYEELEPAKSRGFNRVVLTLYRFGPTPQAVANFASAHPEIAAVVVPDVRVTDHTWPSVLQAVGVPVYVNTINTQARADALFGWGVTGLFTDVLFDPTVPPPFAPELLSAPADQSGAVPPDASDAGTATDAGPNSTSVDAVASLGSESMNRPTGCGIGGGPILPLALIPWASARRRKREAIPTAAI